MSGEIVKAFSVALEIAVMFWGDGSGLILNYIRITSRLFTLYLIHETQETFQIYLR